MFQLPSVLSGTLACVAGTVAGRSWDLSAGTFVIGRNDTSDLALPVEPGVSKTHAKILAEGDNYVLVDCESRNGTIINGVPVQRKVLTDGDEVRICGCVLRFTQRGGVGSGPSTRVRNIDQVTDDSQFIPQQQPMHGASDTQRADAGGDFVGGTVTAPSYPPRNRVLAVWYASGLVGTLLFGGGLAGVLVLRAGPANADDSKIAVNAPATPGATPPGATPPAATPPGTPPATTPPAATPPATPDAATTPPPPPAPPPPAEAPPAANDDKAVDDAPAEKLAVASTSKKGRNSSSSSSRNTLSRREEAAPAETETAPTENEGGGKQFAASVDGGKSETVKAKGGKVKSVEVKDGDTVQKGQTLVTFDEGDATDSIQTLKDGIASIEGSGDDSEEAKRELKAKKDKLTALQSKAGGPVVASMSGKLTGFSVTAGTVLRAGESIGRIGDGEVSHKVHVSIDRSTKAKKGQTVTLVLRSGATASGTVSSTSGKSVTVDCGDTGADEVDAVRF